MKKFTEKLEENFWKNMRNFNENLIRIKKLLVKNQGIGKIVKNLVKIEDN